MKRIELWKILDPPFTLPNLAALAAFLILSACQFGQNSVSLEAANTITANFQVSAKAPPRDVSDIKRLLDQAKPKNIKQHREYKALVESPIPKDLSENDLLAYHASRGLAARELGFLETALESYSEAITRTTDIELQTVFRISIASIQLQLGEPGSAIDTLNAAFRVFPGATSLLLDLSTTSALIGDLDGVRSYEKRIRQNIGRYRSYAWVKLQQKIDWWITAAEANTAHAEGRWNDAIRLRRRQLNLFPEAWWEQISAGIATYYSKESLEFEQERLLITAIKNSGNLLEAELASRENLKKALDLFGIDSGETATSLTVLADILLEQGREDEAQFILAEAEKIFLSLNAPARSIHINANLFKQGTIYALSKNWAKAIKKFDIVENNLGKSNPLYQHRFERTLPRALTLLNTGRVRDALDLAIRMKAKAVKQLGEKHERTAQALSLLALIQWKSGDTKEALVNFRKAIPILLTRSRNADVGERGAAESFRRNVMEGYIALLASSGGAESARQVGLDPVAEAFLVANQVRSRSVQRALSASMARTTVNNPELADFVRREQDAKLSIATLYGNLAAMASFPSQDRYVSTIHSIRVQIDQLRKARAALAEEIEKRFPDYAELMNPKPATIDQAQKALRPDEALIATYVGEKETYVWAVPKVGPVVFAAVPLGEKRISAAVGQLRRALNPRAVKLGDIPAFDVATSHRLYRELLGRVEAGWKDARGLLVVAHGALGQLPFSVLVTESASIGQERAPLFTRYRKVPFLARSHTVTVLPSVSALATLRALPPAAPTRHNFAGFGDPLFSPGQAAAASSPDKKTAALTSRELFQVRGLPVHLRSAPRLDGTSSADLARLPRLPDTADEVKGIALALNADLTRDVFIGREASEGRVKEMNLSGYRVLAFATHGLVPGDLNGLTQPALALTSPSVAGGKDDGLLTMGEILGLRLDADWVVLSACNTASGDGAGAEAVSGLGRAFFYAGTRALLVSNWSVETTSARALTTDVFRRQAGNATIGRAEALRQSMLALVDGPGFRDGQGRTVFSYAHPIFGAPFSLVGDGGNAAPRADAISAPAG